MSEDNCQIFICHLPKDISKNELEEEFQEFGTIRKIEIKNKFAFIEYKSAQSAKDAILKMDGNKVFGNKIVVQNAFKGEKKKDKSNNSENSSYSEKPYKRKNYNEDECFNCGKIGHWAKDCPEKHYKKHLNKRCYYCDKKGHLERDCPLKKNCNSYRATEYKKKRKSYYSKSYSSSSYYSRSRSRTLKSGSSYSSKSYSSCSSYSSKSSYSSSSSRNYKNKSRKDKKKIIIRINYLVNKPIIFLKRIIYLLIKLII